jgi:hypothetical protein
MTYVPRSQPLPLFEVRAHRLAGDEAERVERATVRYTVTSAVEALVAFAADRPDICTFDVGRQGWQLECVTPGVGVRPARRLMNWERNPDAEVSDGWLSNIAAAGNSLADRLVWEPQFCARAHWSIPCPGGCGGELRELSGRQWGSFYRCPGCDWKTGVTTKKAAAAEANARRTGWCGTPLEVRYNRNGVPYAGCPTCAPDYEAPTVNDVYYGRAR